MAATISIALLAVLTIIGFYTLHGISGANTLYDQIEAQGAARRLSQSDTSLSWPSWLESLNVLVLPGTLAGFFWPCVEPANPTIALVGVVFGAQAVAALTAVIVDGWRKGNLGRIVAWTTVYAQLVQFGGFAFMTPLFLLLHLLTAGTSSTSDLQQLQITDISRVKALPLSFLVGFILPSIAMALPHPTVLGLDAKLGAIELWQIFPILVYVVNTVISGAVSSVSKPQGHLKYLRQAYAFAFGLASAGHIGVVTMSITSVIAPSMFSRATALALHPRTLFLPNLSPLTQQVPDIAAGSLNFLQWDYAVGSVALMVWAITVTGSTLSSNAGAVSDFSLGNVLVDAVVRTVSFGPMAAALSFVWERDEIAWNAGGVAGKKTN